MTDNNDYVGTDTATDEGQLNPQTDKQVDPSVIRKSTTKTLLNALSQASGQPLDSMEAAIAYVARLTNSQTNVDNAQSVEVESVQKQKRMGRRTEDTDLREQFSKLQADLQMKEQQLRNKELDTEILRLMGDRFDSELLEYSLQKVKNNIQITDNGPVIVNSKGQERYDMSGNPLTLAGLVEEVAKGNPKLLKQSNQLSGSGLRPGQQGFAGQVGESIPDYSRDPAAFEAWAAKNGLGKGRGLKSTTVSASQSIASRKIL